MAVIWGSPMGRTFPGEEAGRTTFPVAPEIDASRVHRLTEALMGTTADQEPDRSANGPTGETSSAGDVLQTDDIQKLVERLNAELSPSREVHFDAGAPVGKVWLNVIDQRTGEVIERIPPERVRELAAADGPASAYQGLAVDKRV